MDWNQINERVGVSNWLEHIGYLSQQPYLFNGTVRDNLTMMIPGETLDEPAIERLIERLELTDCLGEKPLDFELLEGGNNLSGGQQQRLAILRALRVHRPVLILDEATSALDGVKRDAVFESAARAGKRRDQRIAHHPRHGIGQAMRYDFGFGQHGKRLTWKNEPSYSD